MNLFQKACRLGDQIEAAGDLRCWRDNGSRTGENDRRWFDRRFFGRRFSRWRFFRRLLRAWRNRSERRFERRGFNYSADDYAARIDWRLGNFGESELEEIFKKPLEQGRIGVDLEIVRIKVAAVDVTEVGQICDLRKWRLGARRLSLGIFFDQRAVQILRVFTHIGGFR